MKTIGYVRCSTDKQEVSEQAQEVKIRQMAALKDMAIDEIIVDSDASAKSLDRPGMERLLGMVADGEVSIVIIAKLDRITRSVVDLASLLNVFDKKKVHLISIEESLDTKSASGRLVLNIMVSVSQWEREAIGERTRAALGHIKREGFQVGEASYGYTSRPRTDEEKRLKIRLERTPNPAEQKILDMMTTLRDKGESYGKIAAYLNERELFNREGNPWVPQRVFGILKNQRKATV